MKKIVIFAIIFAIIFFAAVLLYPKLTAKNDPLPASSSSGAPVIEKTYANPDASESDIPEDGSISGTLGSGGSSYSVTADPNIFFRTSGDGFDRYYLSAGSSDNSFLEIRYIDSVQACDIAPSFLDRFFDYTDIEFSGENPVDNTGLIAETIQAKNGDIYMDAFLFNTSSGVIAVTISYTSQSESDSFHNLLDTLVLE